MVFMRCDHGWQKCWLFSLLDHQKKAFLHLSGKLTLLIKVSKAVHFTDFLVHAVYTAILSSIWKNNNTIFTISKIQTMRKLNNLTTTLFVWFFLTIVRFSLLEWWHLLQNLLPFLFSLRNLSLFSWPWDDSGQIWWSKLQHTPHKKPYSAFNM